MAWLQDFMQPWFIWAIVGLLLILAEFTLPGLIVIFFGVGALVVSALTAVTDVSLFVQLLVFLVVSVGLLLGLRRWLRRIFTGRKRNGADATERTSDFEGEHAAVVAAIPADGEGRIELHGTEWDAVAEQPIEVGARVVVAGQDGSIMKVRKLG